MSKQIAARRSDPNTYVRSKGRCGRAGGSGAHATLPLQLLHLVRAIVQVRGRLQTRGRARRRARRAEVAARQAERRAERAARERVPLRGPQASRRRTRYIRALVPACAAQGIGIGHTRRVNTECTRTRCFKARVANIYAARPNVRGDAAARAAVAAAIHAVGAGRRAGSRGEGGPAVEGADHGPAARQWPRVERGRAGVRQKRQRAQLWLHLRQKSENDR
eukprot:6207115-Pleurochrysis_carterae.AAC.1